MHKKRRKKHTNNTTDLGKVIDMPFDKFVVELDKQKVNIGVNNNLILLLEATYNDLRQRKDLILDLVFTGKKSKEEVQPALNGLYAEMTKLEQKIVYLKERSKKLLDLNNTTS